MKRKSNCFVSLLIALVMVISTVSTSSGAYNDNWGYNNYRTNTWNGGYEINYTPYAGENPAKVSKWFNDQIVKVTGTTLYEAGGSEGDYEGEVVRGNVFNYAMAFLNESQTRNGYSKYTASESYLYNFRDIGNNSNMYQTAKLNLAWLVANDLVRGRPIEVNGKKYLVLDLDKPITRAEMATFLQRLIEYNHYSLREINSGNRNFPDIGNVKWAAESINWAWQHGIMVGDNQGKFNPNGNITVEEILKTFYNLMLCTNGKVSLIDWCNASCAVFYMTTPYCSADISTNAARVTLYEGQSTEVKVYYTSNKTLISSVKDSSIVSTSKSTNNGVATLKITANRLGSTSINLKLSGNDSTAIRIDVEVIRKDGNGGNNGDYWQDYPSGINVSTRNLTIRVGQDVYVNAKAAPEGHVRNDRLYYYSERTDLFTVDEYSGRITGRYPGTGTLRIETQNDGYGNYKTVFIDVTITSGNSNSYPDGIRVYSSNPTLNVGGSITIDARMYPAGSYSDVLHYESSDTRVFTVDSNGRITAQGSGNAQLTIWTKSDNYGNRYVSTLTVIVNGGNSSYYPEGIRVYSSYQNLNVGESVTIDARAYPEGNYADGLHYYSEDTGVFTVDNNGRITAEGPGQANLRIETRSDNYGNYHKAWVNVTVNGGSTNLPVSFWACVNGFMVTDLSSMSVNVFVDSTNKTASQGQLIPTKVELYVQSPTRPSLVISHQQGKDAFSDALVRGENDSDYYARQTNMIDCGQGVWRIEFKFLYAGAVDSPYESVTEANIMIDGKSHTVQFKAYWTA